MVPYNKNLEPNWQWTSSSSVQASIILDQPANTIFTNLDEISGRVILRCTKAVNITSIVVKLEGESRTRLLGQRTPGSYDKDDTKQTLETHKILYQVLSVFPPANVADARNAAKGVFTLPSGNHEYPFKFKIPFNNACFNSQPSLPGIQLNRSSLGLEMTREPSRHVKQTLPPTLTGFPGEAEISYFVKTTIARQGLLKENPRAFSPFSFLPIEPPRPPATGEHRYARQKYDFSSAADATKKSKMKSLFSGASSNGAIGDGQSLSVDIRLPEPPIITCNQALPLSIVVKKLNGATGMLYMQSLQVALVGYTKVTAHEFERLEQQNWVLLSRSNMQTPIGSASDTADQEITLDSDLWRTTPLPTTIAPSFVTCNIQRYYQIDVRIGLSYTGRAAGSKPQTVVLPFKLDTQVFSGIAPPAQVLSRMAAAKAQQDNGKPTTPVIVDIPSTSSATDAKLPLPDNKPAVAEPAHAPDSSFADAPPSYEDVIAADLPPVDGYRPAYAPPAAAQDNLLFRDEKHH
ncbi:hypothetical protein AMS68_003449 [Peltaster fructicola]|uniref:Arrestin-like N-terminal domain-containing protein n=1 Tax=Peltaster fructicola TaxID=286661 RepID=A0A6H0XT36_9PEZI|nr:hypothetical protein AMS68_003449 [Peltaster fructicola]